MERVFQKTQMLGASVTTKMNDLFRQKVQLEDQLKDVEAQIHYSRGALDALSELQAFIQDTQKGDSSVDNLELPAVAKPLFSNDGPKERVKA